MSNYHTRIFCLLWFTMTVIISVQSSPNAFQKRFSATKHSQNSKNQCGIRSWGAPLNNATQLSNFDEEHFRAFPDSFPWVFELLSYIKTSQVTACQKIFK